MNKGFGISYHYVRFFFSFQISFSGKFETKKIVIDIMPATEGGSVLKCL